MQMSPAGAQSSQMEQPALGSPCAKGLLSAGLGRAVLKAADGSELRAHIFYLLLPKGAGSYLLIANPPFTSPSGRNELNKYLYLCL